MDRKTIIYAGLATVAVIVAGLVLNGSFGGGNTTVASLPQKTHVHGIAVDPQDPSRLLLATHHGFHVASSDGAVKQVSETTADFMGFTPHPMDASILYASGHPARGGNLGFIESTDGGRTWNRLSEGAAEYGPVDIHMMDVSKADPKVIYGVYRELQVSRDGGRTWQTVDVPPRRMIDLAASAKDANTIYAGTEAGLLISMDGGKSWNKTKLAGQPVSVVEVDDDGRIFAFVVGAGLMQGAEGSPNWETLSSEFGERILLHLAADPSNKGRLFAVTQESEVLTSQDGGKTWRPFGAS